MWSCFSCGRNDIVLTPVLWNRLAFWKVNRSAAGCVPPHGVHHLHFAYCWFSTFNYVYFRTVKTGCIDRKLAVLTESWLYWPKSGCIDGKPAVLTESRVSTESRLYWPKAVCDCTHTRSTVRFILDFTAAHIWWYPEPDGFSTHSHTLFL